MTAATTARRRPSAQIDLRSAIWDAVKKLNPWHLRRNLVILVVAIGASLCTLLWLARKLTGHDDGNGAFDLSVIVWLWLTVLFANFAESLAERRGQAQAQALRAGRQDVQARRLSVASADAAGEMVAATALRRDDLVRVHAGEPIPSDGDVVLGIASVDESAITGESAPVIREGGGDRSAVTGGTRVLSDWLVIRITAAAGDTFVDRMIALVEGAKRQKTPNERALDVLLTGLTVIFVLVTATLWPFAQYAAQEQGQTSGLTLVILVALLVCLIPTTIGGLLSAIGIAGIDRLVQANVIATSGRAVEAAGDVDVLFLDKTGTITYGNRQASALLPAPGVELSRLAAIAHATSAADETAEGRSIVSLSAPLRGPQALSEADLATGQAIPFSAHTRMSGLDLGPRQLRKGAAGAIDALLTAVGGGLPAEIRAEVERVGHSGATPLVVIDGHEVLGVIVLKDVVKSGIRERFAQLRQMGIKTLMITGDNPNTAAAIAAEAGVDDFVADATPEAKLALLRRYQQAGHLVAMTGDGTNDAPALAQADVAVAMNTGTQAAKEAGNMVDLDSNPTKLLHIVEIGKQMLMTRGALTTFSIANDIAKYFVIIPAIFVSTYPQLALLNLMHLHSAHTAVLSAVIFNAVIIVALVPLALRGVPYRPQSAALLLRRNLLIYGLGGVIVPFPCIKLLDLLLSWVGGI